MATAFFKFKVFLSPEFYLLTPLKIIPKQVGCVKFRQEFCIETRFSPINFSLQTFGFWLCLRP